MNFKLVLFICLLMTFSTFSNALNITWLDPNGIKIPDPNKNSDAAFWMGAMDNAMRDIYTKCLPPYWRSKTRDFYNSNRPITIMISDDVVNWNEAENEKKAKKNLCICASRDSRYGDIWIFFRPEQSHETREEGCCFCKEATALHELIHAAAGIPDSYDPQIEACLYLALKTAGDCATRLPEPNCDCMDNKGGKPPATCK